MSVQSGTFGSEYGQGQLVRLGNGTRIGSKESERERSIEEVCEGLEGRRRGGEGQMQQCRDELFGC